MISETVKKIARNLADKQATPFYIFDLSGIENKTIHFATVWKKFFPKFRLAYSYKTNSLKTITRLLRTHDASAEVVSGPELEWALEDGFDPKMIFFDGPVKQTQELIRALSLGVRIQIDSLDELDGILKLCREGSYRPSLSPRMATCYHEKKQSRFGMTTEEFYLAGKEMNRHGYSFQGIHFHVGSNVNTSQKYIAALNEYLPTIHNILNEAEQRAIWLDIGGGFPAKSLARENHPLDIEIFAHEISDFFEKNRLPKEHIELVTEPGRGIVEDFGYLVTSVAVTKKRPYGHLVIVDAGINLARSIGSWFHPVEFVREPSGNEVGQRYQVFGSNCFESDLFAENVIGPDNVHHGDLLIVGETGGYDIPSANIWTRPSPPIFGFSSESDIVDIRREQNWRDMRSRQYPENRRESKI